MPAGTSAGPPRPSERAGAPGWLARAAAAVARLAGWRRWLVAFATGAISVLALAPFFLWPVLFLTLPALLWLIDGARQLVPASAGRNVKRALQVGLLGAIAGWWHGFGFHLLGLFWIGEAFLVEAEVFAAMLPAAVTSLPAGLALFHAAAAALAAQVEGPAWRRVLALAVALAATEWLRGHILTGFPWNVLGYALTQPLVLMQSASAIGIYGLTLLTVIVCAGPAAMLAEQAGRWRLAATWPAISIALAPLLGMLAYGTLRLGLPEPAPVEGVRLRLVQPSIPQREKWRPEQQGEFFRRHLELSLTGPDGRRDDLAGITHVVWSEAAMPFLPLAHPEALAAIGHMLPDRVVLLAGALRMEAEPLPGSDRRRAWNSLLVLDDEGRLAGLYDKIHLVPFGEYLPFQATLEAIGLEQLTRWRGGFSTGPLPRTLLEVAGLPPVAPLICYEGIFPATVVQGGDRPGLLLNVTNDGWFGDTTGPHQHFHQARVRAVEEGVPLVRVANNGISAVIDARGRVLARLGLGAVGVADSALPGRLAPPLYSRYGDSVFWLLWLVGLAGLALTTRRTT